MKSEEEILTERFVFPCSYKLGEIIEKELDLDIAKLEQMVERHKCRMGYCLRYMGKKKKYICRFGYPKIKSEKNSYVEIIIKVKNVNSKKKKPKTE